MAKCAICGSRLGLLSKPIKLYDEEICRDCWTRLGFGPEDVEKYKYKSSKYLAKGKAAIVAEEEAAAAIKEYTFKVVGVTHKQNGADPQKILGEYMNENSPADDYQGMTAKDIKEDCSYEDPVFKYDPAEFEPVIEETTFEGSPALRVFLGGDQIGWIAADKVETVRSLLSGELIDITGEVVGGPYKFLDYEDKVRSKSAQFGATITLKVNTKHFN